MIPLFQFDEIQVPLWLFACEISIMSNLQFTIDLHIIVAWCIGYLFHLRESSQIEQKISSCHGLVLLIFIGFEISLISKRDD